jgi:hypothetical protein
MQRRALLKSALSGAAAIAAPAIVRVEKQSTLTFVPGTPMATDVGAAITTAPRTMA